MTRPDVVPFSFDLSSLVQRPVVSLYSNLVTRPTGSALRVGIESLIKDLNTSCVSVLDFANVNVLDFSCADEAVAKLLQRFQPQDRPADAYFVARGVLDHHREPLEEVLIRHGLVLVAEVAGVGYTLLGAPSLVEQLAWAALQQASVGSARDLAGLVPHPEHEIASALESLSLRRAVLPAETAGRYYALSAVLA